jgi:hypothetical protein
LSFPSLSFFATILGFFHVLFQSPWFSTGPLCLLTVVSNNVLTVTDIHWWIHSVKRSRKQWNLLVTFICSRTIESFILFQVTTQKVVHGDLNFALTKGIGCVRAGLIWLYNVVLLLTLVLVCKFLDRMLEFVIIIKLYFLYPITYLLQET